MGNMVNRTAKQTYPYLSIAEARRPQRKAKFLRIVYRTQMTSTRAIYMLIQ